jgi:hypothetical protein
VTDIAAFGDDGYGAPKSYLAHVIGRSGLAAAFFVVISLVGGGSASAKLSAPRSFGTPGPLAVTPNGVLYVASGQELYKLVDERLVPFVSAGQTIDSTVAGDGGTIYLGGSDALQSVSPDGAVTTVARLAVGGLGSGPSGAIYVVVNNDIERLVGDKLILVVKATKFDGLSGVPTPVGAELGLGTVVGDGKGDLYVSGEGVGFMNSRPAGTRASSAHSAVPTVNLLL